MVPATLMVVVLVLFNLFHFPYDTHVKAILKIGFYALVGGSIYIGVSYKMGLLDDILGKEMMRKIIKKLTLGKLEVKN